MEEIISQTAADVRVKRVYDPPSEEDGARVLVDRLWPRGLRKESLKLSLWLKEIAPSPELRTWFGHDPARFEAFAQRYSQELAMNGPAVARIEELVKQGRVSLLYAAHDSNHNHALVLADYLRGKIKTECELGKLRLYRCLNGNGPRPGVQ